MTVIRSGATCRLHALVEFVGVVYVHDLQDLDHLFLFGYLIKHCEGSADMETVQLIIEMQKLFITIATWEWVFRKSAAPLFNYTPALLWKR